MDISKTTINFSTKRGIHCLTYDGEFNYITLSDMADEDSDAELVYIWNDDDSFTYYGNTWLAGVINEELPATIWNEKHLREVIAFLCFEVNSNKQESLN